MVNQVTHTVGVTGEQRGRNMKCVCLGREGRGAQIVNQVMITFQLPVNHDVDHCVCVGGEGGGEIVNLVIDSLSTA